MRSYGCSLGNDSVPFAQHSAASTEFALGVQRPPGRGFVAFASHIKMLQ